MSKTYYTYRIRVENLRRVQIEKYDAQHQSLGESNGAFRKRKITEAQPILELAKNNTANVLDDSAQTKALGETLFEVLFDEVLRQDFVNFYDQVIQKEKQLLRVELDIDEQIMPQVAALPWEFICLPQQVNQGEIRLGTDPNIVFSRRRSQWNPAPPIQLQKGEKLRIALVISAPANLGKVRYEKIQEALEKLANEQTIPIELLPMVSSANAEKIDEILEKQPHIFHFIGHGRLKNESQQEIGQIALTDSNFEDEAMWVDADYFSSLFAQHRPGVVMLQACEGGQLSASQAFAGVASRIVQMNIPVVIAMQYEISNISASLFARKFYERLAKGDPVDIAAQNGRRAIALGSSQYRQRDFATPVIFMRVQDGYLFQKSETNLDTEEQTRIIQPGLSDTPSLMKDPTKLTQPEKPVFLEAPEGSVNEDSSFYVPSPLKENACKAIVMPGAMLRIKSPPGMGKSSLTLAVLGFAKEQGYQTVTLDFKQTDTESFESLKTLTRWFCALVGNELLMEFKEEEYWKDKLGSNINCTNFFSRYVLKEVPIALTLVLENLDRLFEFREIEGDFCGLLRAWHEKAKRDDLWKQLRLIIVYSQESYQPRDINQSPFNVGIPISVGPWTEKQVTELALKHGLDWQNKEIAQLMEWTGGHPHLVRLALYNIASGNQTLAIILQNSATEGGIYRSHLLERLNYLEKQPELKTAMLKIVTTDTPVQVRSKESAKLYDIGLIKLQDKYVLPFCRVYREYFRERLKE